MCRQMFFVTTGVKDVSGVIGWWLGFLCCNMDEIYFLSVMSFLNKLFGSNPWSEQSPLREAHSFLVTAQKHAQSAQFKIMLL